MLVAQARSNSDVQDMLEAEREARMRDRIVSGMKMNDEQRPSALRDARQAWAVVHRHVRQFKADPTICLRAVRHA